MHQLTLFAPTEPAKVLKFPTPATAPKPQETGLEAIYPQPNYGTCLKCESSIIWPGLDTCKCSGCGYVATKFVTFSLEYPKVKPAEVVPVEPAPVVDTETATKQAKGKVLSMFTTRTRAEKMGKPDPFLAGIKTCTRRLMAPSTADYYQRAFISGQTIQIYSSGQYAGGVKWADVRLTRAPYEEALKDMPIEDLVAEGDLWESKDEFIVDLCLGRPDPEAKPWVLWFEVVKMYV